MKIKKLFALLLSAVILSAMAAGCGNDSAEESSAAGSSSSTAASTSSGGEESAEEEPVEIRITRPLYFGDASENLDLKEEWMQMVEEKYGVKVSVNYLPRNEYTSKINLLMTSESVDGLVGVFSTNEILNYKDMGVIEPIGTYLENNETWKSMPEDMQNLYLFDGELWGLPAGYSSNLFTRTVRKDWLDNLGMEVPTNLDELYEMAYAFTYDDPDGNGVDDTYGLTASGTWNLQDIFQAFGARLDSSGSGSIAYDPIENCWVDSMLKPEMVDCLTYLNKMYEEGLLDPELFTNSGSNMREKFWAGEYGSTFYWLGFSGESAPYLTKITPDVEFAEISYLKGNIDHDINCAWYSTVPYVMVADTPDADKMVQEFVDLALGSQESHFDFAYGIEGKTYRVDGNTVYTLVDPDTDTPMTTPSLTTYIPAYYDDFTFLTDGLDAEAEQTAIDLLNFKKSVINEGLEEGGIFRLTEVTITPFSDTYLMIQADITTAFETAVSSAITGTVDPQTAVDTYLAEVKALGAQDVLDEANEAAGLTGTLSY